ncbi:Uncharacterised protein [Streptococcus acidominimus]|uniref:PIN like domain-containing protein n=1 Tax=Streptococcus acidominimus TaxID=1326 RepID=A0A380JKZ2_STRAI|nr:PIN-like domain-containing protein [Streptococcus acidominimus]SUN40918.1 Uncharacterised protein [Streptococcus acidominimus]
MFKWLDSVQLGTAYDSDTLTRYREQIAKRYEKKVSPGFMDLESKKGQVIQLGTQTLERGYSDAVFWLDILDYINSKSFKQYKYLVIVSNETKPDWVINKEPSKLKIDLFTECHEETGLIARKMSIWELLKLTNSATKDEISESKLLAKDYNFSLYGEFYAADNQARMMEKIFEKILSRVDASMFSIPCILSTSDSSWEEQKNSTFDRYIIISDKSSKDYAVGTSLNFLQKLRYIYDLLEQRHAGSSGQLKFSNIENQEQWEEICQKRRVG